MTGHPRHGPRTTRSDGLDVQARSWIQPRISDKWSPFDYPGSYTSICSSAQLHLPNTDTRGRVALSQIPLAIKTVTPITCHQSQITSESTCPMGVCIPRENRLIHSMLLTTSMTWLMFYEPGSQTISLDMSDVEASGNPQDAARDARFSSRAGSRTRTSKRRKTQGRPQENKMLICSPICSLPTHRPQGRSALCYAQWLPPDRWLRVAALLVVFLLLSNNKGFLWLFCAL